jgi:hypothetical protein
MNVKKAGNEIRTGAIVVAVLATLFPTGCVGTTAMPQPMSPTRTTQPPLTIAPP